MDDDFSAEFMDDIETFEDESIFDADDSDDERDWEEEAYWADFQRRERQEAYDDEWPDPLDMPSYSL